MPDNLVLIDTDILIEVGRGVREAVICLQQIGLDKVEAVWSSDTCREKLRTPSCSQRVTHSAILRRFRLVINRCGGHFLL